MPIKDKKALKVWLALTLNVLFFHPLFATLHDKKHYMDGKSERGRLCPLR